MAESATILVTCPKELPQYLKSELAALGFSGLRELTAGVETTGTLTDCMRLNLWVRTGHRVLYELARFRAPGPDVLYKAASRIDWEEMIPADGYLSVNASLRTDAVNDSRFAALKLKDAIVDRIRAKRGKRPDAGPEFKGCAVFMHWRDDQAIIYLDTSGEPLSRRGYRVMPHTAPLQETLAAGMLLGSGYESGHFVNPMCGSGTLAIEAALIGLHRAPGLTRDHFAFQHMLGYDRKGFEALKAEARSAERPVPGGRIIATDIDPQAIKAARTNAERAGVDGLIEFKACDFRETDLPEPPGVVMLNPEYGRRLGDEKQLEIVYTAIGDFFKQRCGGYMGYVFTGNLGLAKKVGLRTRRRMIFFNAKIECRLLEYELYAGTRKGGG